MVGGPPEPFHSGPRGLPCRRSRLWRRPLPAPAGPQRRPAGPYPGARERRAGAGEGGGGGEEAGAEREALLPSGRELLARNPPCIDIPLPETYPAFLQFYRNARDCTGENEAGAEVAPPPAPATVTPEEQVEAAYAALQAALRQDCSPASSRTRRPSSSASSSPCWWPWAMAAHCLPFPDRRLAATSD